jgi:glutamate formiminotransferase
MTGLPCKHKPSHFSGTHAFVKRNIITSIVPFDDVTIMTIDTCVLPVKEQSIVVWKELQLPSFSVMK